MFSENKIFKYALITSICIHIFFIVVLLITNIQYYREDKEKVVEVIYQSQTIQEKTLSEQQKHIKSVRSEKKLSIPQLLTQRDHVPPQPLHDKEKALVKLKMGEKSSIRINKFGEKRQIKIPMLDSDKMMGSRYMTYHEQVREKIRNRAYFYVDDPEFESGEVYLTFVLASSGDLKQVKVIHDKTQANNYLRSVGMRSIKESSPYPSFPKDLNYPELTFNVVISFEMGE